MSLGLQTVLSDLSFLEDSVFPIAVASSQALESRVRAALAYFPRLSIA